VQTGETLIGIAALYDVPAADLMAWNGLDAGSIIQPDQQLLLQVTPPAPPSAAPALPTATAFATGTPEATLTQTPTQIPPAPTEINSTAQQNKAPPTIFFLGWILGAAGVVLLVAVLLIRRGRSQGQDPR